MYGTGRHLRAFRFEQHSCIGVIEMPCDDDLVECVGMDNVRKICKKLGCMIYIICLPRGGDSELCIECHEEIKRQYPECVEG